MAKKPHMDNTPKNKMKGKDEGAQTRGQYERDPKKRTGNYTAAGDPPRMIK